jgi:hypothetical protein
VLVAEIQDHQVGAPGGQHFDAYVCDHRALADAQFRELQLGELLRVLVHQQPETLVVDPRTLGKIQYAELRAILRQVTQRLVCDQGALCENQLREFWAPTRQMDHAAFRELQAPGEIQFLEQRAVLPQLLRGLVRKFHTSLEVYVFEPPAPLHQYF